MYITVIIPNYNGEFALQQNLPQVIKALNYYIKTTNNNGELIIVDDKSTDKSIEIIDKFIKTTKEFEIKLLRNVKNYGFSTSINTGVRVATGEIIVLLNSDVKPDLNFLIPLIKNFSQENVFAAGCMDKSIEDTGTVLRGRGLGKWMNGLLHHTRGDVNNRNTLWVSGGSGAFNKKIWHKLGGLYTIYNPFYWEDIDLSYRALKAGYNLIFESKSEVTHLHSSGSIRTHFDNSKIKTISYRNQIIFSWINMSDTNLVLQHFIWLPLLFIKSLLKMDLSFIIGLILAVFKISRILELRKSAQKLAVLSDKEAIESIKI